MESDIVANVTVNREGQLQFSLIYGNVAELEIRKIVEKNTCSKYAGVTETIGGSEYRPVEIIWVGARIVNTITGTLSVAHKNVASDTRLRDENLTRQIDFQHGQRLGQSIQTRRRPFEGGRRDSGIDKRRKAYHSDPWTNCPVVARMRRCYQQRGDHRRPRLQFQSPAEILREFHDTARKLVAETGTRKWKRPRNSDESCDREEPATCQR